MNSSYAIKVDITRIVDASNPGWVECTLTDAIGKRWLFCEKGPVVSTNQLDQASSFPCDGIIACQILDRIKRDDGKISLTVDTVNPWGVASTCGVSTFVVLEEQVVEW